jgi:uncharacterized phage-like protein YoqJ
LKVCSFTGHRTVADGVYSSLAKLIDAAVDYAYKNGCRKFYTGGARGFDTMAARAVILYRISHPDVRLCLLLPCKNQSEKWCGSEVQSYEYILSVADEVEYVRDDYTDGCMRERNFKLAAVCDILIAYSGRQKSGSAQTVRFAKEAGKTVYNLYARANGINS